MLHYTAMIRSKDINHPSANLIVEAVRLKVLHLGAMFGTEATITHVYRSILFQLPEKAKRRDLERIVGKVEKAIR